MSNTGLSALNIIGNPTPKIDAVERVSGAAKYTRDFKLPGMLYAKILRSPHPHALIKRINTRKAAELPGVMAVITHENANVVWGAGSVSGGRQYSDEIKKITKHQRYIFNNPVRFVGDSVAAVAATNRYIADEALKLIEVEYEILPFVLEPEEALKGEAPKIWPEGNLCPDGDNLTLPIKSTLGNIAQGFDNSDQIFEGRFSTAFVHNAQMEPRSALAVWEADKLTLYTPTQGISNCRHDTARDLGLADHQVRIICSYMGGGFGNKNQNQDADLIAATLAKQSNSPVMLEFSRRDDWLGVHGRWPTVQYYKVGLKNSGQLEALSLKAYSGMGPYRKNWGGVSGVDVYTCPNLDREIYPVYTNKTTSGNFRGPGDTQGFFGIQSMMDEIAFKMNIDPVEFALANMRRPSENDQFTNYTLDQCIERGVELFRWHDRRKVQPGSDQGPIKRGAGFSFMMFRAGLGASSAIIKVDSTGTYTLYIGVTDIGPGAKTTLGMIAAESLNVPLSNIEVVWGDTDRCPYSVGESGSRTTMMTGYAIVEAAKDLRGQIEKKGMPEGPDFLISSATPQPNTDGKTRQCFAAHFAEVEVDIELGSTKIIKYLTVHESGRLINPQTAKDQIRGAALMGIGEALHENTIYDTRHGYPLTTGFYGGRHLTHLDVPDIEVHFIETDDGYGPFGAKTAGEAGIIMAAATVSNAITNAIGARVYDLPITKDKIIGALS